ncbi:hypothetical protein [Lactobacillus delbrueckii]|nr:hypothetical protein [Lactobacillus delbrueckii]EGD27154.1 hypothetical protein HMPREF5505_1166 [Lactobacillus delbrueckii subsp. lactis DSM 20072]
MLKAESLLAHIPFLPKAAQAEFLAKKFTILHGSASSLSADF